MKNHQSPITSHQIITNVQITNNQTNKIGLVIQLLGIGIYLVIVIWLLVIVAFPSFAQDNDKLVALSKQIIEAKTNEDLYAPFNELKDLYFSRPDIKSEGGTPLTAGKDKYSEFVDFLKSLSSKKKWLEPFTNYYIALTRYNQLKYLEENQLWDEYFSQGNNYRDELTQGAQKAIDGTAQNDALNIYARLILWQFHKDQQDVFSDTALTDLMNSVLEYAKVASDTKPIKEVADKFLSYGEKGKSKELYKIYADKIMTLEIKNEDLKNIAFDFYKQGRSELSQAIYDVYIDRIVKSSPKEKLIPILVDIAKQFAYKDEGLKDELFAEKIFEKIEELGGKDSFDQELIYLRALNLEKIKEYAIAKDIYIDLIERFPSYSFSDEANFKVAIIYAYVLRDIKMSRNYLEKLAKKETNTPQVISSLYQLGLLSQYEEDYIKAKDYYNSLIEKVKFDFAETASLAKMRIKEIEEEKPIEYNLKVFLDASLKEENAVYDMTKVALKSYPYRASKEKNLLNFSATTYIAESGCMQVELLYLWSGDLGSKTPSSGQPTFDTAYTDSGTKLISLIVTSPAGIIDRSFDFVDVY